MNDVELIEYFIAGDENAFNELVKRHQAWVTDFVRSMVKHAEDSEDISQDIFVKLYFKLPTFRFESEFKTWLYRIVMNQTNNYFRKQKLLSWFGFELKTETEDSTKYSFDVELKSALLIASKKLPKVQRNIVLLRIYQDMSFKQISQILSISENSAKVSFHKAKINLKGYINE